MDGGVVGVDSAAVAVTITADRLGTSEPTTARGDISPPDGKEGPQEATQQQTRTQQSIGMRTGVWGGSIPVKQMQQSAGIEVEKWEKIQQLLDTFAAAREVMQTQQPTEYAEKDKNERMQRAGEEGGITNNTTINRSG
eukprot:scaffold150917_cov36-Cyclotella_meneghiniana.AAC.1